MGREGGANLTDSIPIQLKRARDDESFRGITLAAPAAPVDVGSSRPVLLRGDRGGSMGALSLVVEFYGVLSPRQKVSAREGR